MGLEGDLLDGIKGPEDLKKLDGDELGRLAQEIRERIIEVTSGTGGHLASSLGAVELAIALHRTFNSPRDKLIWDVSHQAYAHKILTGRNERFHTLRKKGGVCGFTRRSESEHDAVDAGHASTSISYALAFAIARDLSGEDYQVVAVIGDGALTGGVAYEALNQVGQLKAHLIIVLNDNGMSISRNVGAMSTYLSQLRLNPSYGRLKKDLKGIVESVPLLGEWAGQVVHDLKERIKNMLIPEYIFEELGIQYVGPVDGHNIEAIERDLKLASKAEGPVLLHVTTCKGKGYQPAEECPEEFHGTPPFAISNGMAEKKDVPTFTEVMGATACEMARKNDRVIAITAAMALGTGLSGFAREFPGRFFDVGIAEQHAVALAAGLALRGFRPLVAIYSTFLQRAYDQLVLDVCLQGLPVIFAIDRAGLVGEDGPTHHGALDISYLRPVPNLTIMAPADQEELRDMLWHALELDGPVALRYPRGAGRSKRVSGKPRPIESGKMQLLKEGSEVCILGLGATLPYAIEASKILRDRSGVEATVVNPRFVKPLDRSTLRSLAQGHRVMVTLEDNALMGGFGEGVAAFLAEERHGCAIVRLALPDRFIEHGTIRELHQSVGLEGKAVAERIMPILEQR
jgi:1-deoxy-D-xylulose-5-phosphate synthase